MVTAFRVWGAPGLDDGVRLLAETEQEAVRVVAGIFKLDQAALMAAPVKGADLASRGVLLFGTERSDEFATRSDGNVH